MSSENPIVEKCQRCGKRIKFEESSRDDGCSVESRTYQIDMCTVVEKEGVKSWSIGVDERDHYRYDICLDCGKKAKELIEKFMKEADQDH